MFECILYFNYLNARLYCKAWSLTLREERSLRVFENRIPRRIFGPRRNENGGWRNLQKEELRNLYGSPSRVRVINLED